MSSWSQAARQGASPGRLRASLAAPPRVDALGPLDRPLTEARDAYVAAYCAAVLAHHGGNREAAAAALGISSRSLYRYLTGERA